MLRAGLGAGVANGKSYGVAPNDNHNEAAGSGNGNESNAQCRMKNGRKTATNDNE